MKATAKQLNELRRLRDFFQSWFGDGWNLKLQLRAGLYYDQLNRVIAGHDAMPRGFVGRIEGVQAKILARSACDVRSDGDSDGGRRPGLHDMPKDTAI